MLVVLAVLVHILIWLGLCRIVTGRRIEGVTAAAILFGLWLLFTTLIPVVGKFGIERMVGVPDGGDILLTQRETVNDAWDLPTEATMDRFVEEHPEWIGRTEVGDEGFEWKWYYAFQQVGDQEAQPLSTALYEGIANRDRQMGLVSLFSRRCLSIGGLPGLPKPMLRSTWIMSIVYVSSTANYATSIIRCYLGRSHTRIKLWPNCHSLAPCE